MVKKYPYPEPARTEILALGAHLRMLNDLAWILHYMYKPEAYERYNKIGFINLRAMPWLIHDTLITGIGKLTDPAESRGEKNLNFKTLAKTIVAIDPAYQKLAERVEKRLARKDIKNLRVHRNKRVAHSDYDVHLDKAKLPRYGHAAIEKILRDLTKLLDTISDKTLGAEIMYSNEHDIADEAQRFFEVLDKGLQTEQKSDNKRARPKGSA